MTSRWGTLCAAVCAVIATGTLLLGCTATGRNARADGADGVPRDVEIAPVFPTSAAQRNAGRAHVASLGDEGALSSLRRLAEGARGIEPTPLRALRYEGVLNTDPGRIETTRALYDMERLAWLLNAYTVFGDDRDAAWAERIAVAWALVYAPTGNAVNDNKLLPVAAAAGVLEDRVDDASLATLRGFARSLAEAQAVPAGAPLNNWQAKRINIVGTAGVVLRDGALLARAQEWYRDYVERSLRPDGTSLDLEERDALAYHVSGLKPLVMYAAMTGMAGQPGDWYRWEAPNGASVERSARYVLPYARGEKTRAEWRGTTVELDLRRAAAGLAGYQPGTLFDPATAVGLFGLAAWFDASMAVESQRAFEASADAAHAERDAWLAPFMRVLAR